MIDRITLARAKGTIPSCDHVLLAFAMTLAAKHNWTVTQVCEFLAKPWGYQKEWSQWLREQQEAIHV